MPKLVLEQRQRESESALGASRLRLLHACWSPGSRPADGRLFVWGEAEALGEQLSTADGASPDGGGPGDSRQISGCTIDGRNHATVAAAGTDGSVAARGIAGAARRPRHRSHRQAYSLECYDAREIAAPWGRIGGKRSLTLHQVWAECRTRRIATFSLDGAQFPVNDWFGGFEADLDAGLVH